MINKYLLLDNLKFLQECVENARKKGDSLEIDFYHDGKRDVLKTLIRCVEDGVYDNVD